jgi:hypothetical protein
MSYELWRQDDNGRRFVVGRYLSRDEAERRLVELTRVPHRQIYWIVADREPPGEVDNP